MEEYIKSISKSSIFVSVILMIFSLFLMIKPSESINVIIIAFALVILMDAIFHIISYFKMPAEYRSFNFELVQGVLQLIISIITIVNPNWISAFFPILIGMWIILSSIIRFQLSLSLKYRLDKNWIMVLGFSILTFLFGVFIIIFPLKVTIVITTFCGAFLFVTELINIFQYVIIYIKTNKVK